MNKITNYEIGNRIRELRLKQGLSQEQLALASGITTTYLGLLERNLKNPTIKVLEQICDSLHISLEDFFSDSTKPENYDPLTMQILSQIQYRSDKDKKLILAIIKDISKYSDTD